MSTARQFDELNVWQDARRLAGAIYTASKAGAFNRDFGLRDQIRRAAVSTMSNIAEGFERGNRKEFVQFLSTSKGSNGEVHSQLCVALDQKYTGENEFSGLRESTTMLTKKLSTFIHYFEGHAGNSRVKRPARRDNLQLSTSNPQPE
jgi:four helix bundle protein